MFFQAQLELLHEKTGQYGVMVRRTFPAFDSAAGLRMALSLKIKVSSVLGVHVCFDATADKVRCVTQRAFRSPINGGNC